MQAQCNLTSLFPSFTCTSPPKGNEPRGAASDKPNTPKGCIYDIQYGNSSYSVGLFSKERLTTDVFRGFFFDIAAGQSLSSNKPPKNTTKASPTVFPPPPVPWGTSPSAVAFPIPRNTISRSSPSYGIEEIGITVGGNKLPISASTFSSGGAIIDSSTVVTRLPPTAYSSPRDAFPQGTSKDPSASEVPVRDACYDLCGCYRYCKERFNHFKNY
ncbi:hypothetical protein L6164_031084 [Bauhinia variegata]|uniref:Uncharacterized protein n=1 Tax=Bauhinia variegata TaxID=167791 RepID=A0ACB9LEJ3_BAUVA|nr:hypothetical protein L6164_031084 [Bauhinia variegata]